MKLNEFLVDKERIKKSANKVIDNSIISEYYTRLSEFTNLDKYALHAKRVKGCFKIFDIRHFKKQKVKYIERVNLCHDKFCKNCQNKLSLERFIKFYPMIEEYRKNYDPYHIVLTVPNVPGNKLEKTLDKMYETISDFVKYFDGRRNVTGVAFKKYGYVGAIRSVEINVKNETDGSISYHPHFHCIFMLKKGLKEKRIHINQYSYSKRTTKVTPFTDLEILMQKVFYLRYNNLEVNKKNIDSLPVGYDCYAIKKNTVEGCKEVFKYTLKNEFKYIIDSFEVFKTLQRALRGRRIIQGYGLFYGVDFEKVSKDEVDRALNEILKELGKIEYPDRVYQKLADILNDIRDNPEVKYISKSSIKKALFNGYDK